MKHHSHRYSRSLTPPPQVSASFCVLPFIVAYSAERTLVKHRMTIRQGGRSVSLFLWFFLQGWPSYLMVPRNTHHPAYILSYLFPFNLSNMRSLTIPIYPTLSMLVSAIQEVIKSFSSYFYRRLIRTTNVLPNVRIELTLKEEPSFGFDRIFTLIGFRRSQNVSWKLKKKERVPEFGKSPGELTNTS